MSQLVPTFEATNIFPDSEIAELTWENGSLTMHELGSLSRTASTEPESIPTWVGNNGTLECLVRQATCSQSPRSNKLELRELVGCQNPANMTSFAGSTSGLGTDELLEEEKWTWLGADITTDYSESVVPKETTTRTTITRETPDWAETATENGDFSSKPMKDMIDFGNQDAKKRNFKEEATNKDQAASLSTKRSRSADVHNLLEKNRRHRINQKMKALQKLVPNSNKTDKASMLDEVIEYLKQLQAQVQMMSARAVPHMMMPMAMAQQMQMGPLMAHMGMASLPMTMLDMGPVGMAHVPPSPLMHPASAGFVSPLIASGVPTRASQDSASPISCPSPSGLYCTFLAQSMNHLDYYNRVATFYQQLQQQADTNTPTQANHITHSGI